MIQILTVSDIKFSLNGVEHLKKFFSNPIGDRMRIYNAYNPNDVLLDYTDYTDIEVDGIAFGSVEALQSALIPVLFSADGMGVGGSIDQDNKFLPIWFNYTESPPTTTHFANLVNALPSFIVSEKQLVLFSASIPRIDNPFSPTTYKFVLTNLGKGTYGAGGIEVQPENIAIIYVAQPDESDIINNATTQFFDIADLGGLDIDEYVNAHTPPYVIQDQELGYRVFRVMIDGNEVNYLFLADGGTYGLGELQTLPTDFEAFGNGAIPEPVGVPTLQEVTDEGGTTYNKVFLTNGVEIQVRPTDSDSILIVEDLGLGNGRLYVNMKDLDEYMSSFIVTPAESSLMSQSPSGNESGVGTRPNLAFLESNSPVSEKKARNGISQEDAEPKPFFQFNKYGLVSPHDVTYQFKMNDSHVGLSGAFLIEMPGGNGRMLTTADGNFSAKVDKVTTNDGITKVYIKNGDGTQSVLDINSITIPDASLSVSGKVNLTTQSFKGNKTIQGLDTTTNPALLLMNSSGASIIAFRNNRRAEVTDGFIFDIIRTSGAEIDSPVFRFTGTNVSTQTLFAEQGNVIVSNGFNARGSGGVITPKISFGSTVGSAASPVLQPGNSFKGGLYFVGNTGVGDIGLSTGDTGDATALSRVYIHRSGNVSLGSSTSPNASAQLDVNSTTRGFLPPRMTTTQKNAIASPSNGLVVHDTTLDKLCVYEGSAWQTLATELSISTALSNAVFNLISSASTLTLTVTGIINYYTFNGSTATYTLPVPAGNAGKRIVVINQGSGTVTVNSNAGANVIFESSLPLVNTISVLAGQQYSFYCNGATWSAVA